MGEFVLREVDIERDAAALAAMWRASDDQWPGTWSRGSEITPQMVRERFERERMINVYVFERAGEIVAYCSFTRCEEEENAGMIDLLNVRPDCQGRGLGRRLIQRCIERCLELGFSLLTLGTWPGNLKSVPLYKKTGFFWLPDTEVWMFNFIPAILKMPCAQPYFARHDWYRTFRRELRQVEDDERWEGMKVFTYRWEEGGESLTVWADREARTLTAVETEGFLVAAIAEEIEPPRGMPTSMRWRLRNKGRESLSASLIAYGNEHLGIDYRTTLTLPPGEEVELRAEVQVAADALSVPDSRAAPRVQTVVVLGEQTVELATGMRPRPAVAVSSMPRYITLAPGVPRRVHLGLRSYLQHDVEATLRLIAPPGLHADWHEQPVHLPARGFAGASVELCADDGGVYPLRVAVDPGIGAVRPERVAVFSLPPGGLLADRGETETRLENEWVRLVISSRGGAIRVMAAQSDELLGTVYDLVGPPFWPSELEDAEQEIALREERGRAVAVMSVAMQAYPGLVMRREVVLGAGPLFELGHVFCNEGERSHRLQVMSIASCRRREKYDITVPLGEGVVHSPMSEYPDARGDIPKEPEAFAERWVAMSTRQTTWGVMWSREVVENEVEWGVRITSREVNCQPQQWKAAGRLVFYVGPGDWRTVRAHARRLAGDCAQEELPVEARPVCDVRLEPSPLLVLDDQVTATLVVDNLRGRALEGVAVLHVPSELRVNRDTFAVHGVDRTHPLRESVKFSVPPTATAYECRVSLQTRLFDTQVRLPVVRLGDHRPVAVQACSRGGQGVYVVDNGRTRFVVAPGFGGALVEWVEGGVNHLLSAFPQPRAFGWQSPWYGGVTPLARLKSDEGLGKLHQEKLRGEQVALPDEQGVLWSGVRLSGDLERDQLRGLHVELCYLTTGNSNALKLLYRVRNDTTAPRQIGIGWLAFWQFEGDGKGNTIRSAKVERKSTPWQSWSEAGYWGMATYPSSGRTAILLSPYPNVRLMDWGAEGGHLGWTATVDVEPLATVERTCHLFLCADAKEAGRYALMVSAPFRPWL